MLEDVDWRTVVHIEWSSDRHNTPDIVRMLISAFPAGL